MNQGLCNAGINVWSCISGLRIFSNMKTVANTVEYDNIHLYLHFRYVKSPANNAKKEYQSLVSPIVLRGGRPNVIQNPAIKHPRSIIDSIDRMTENFLPFLKKAIAAAAKDNKTDGAANQMNDSQVIIILCFFYNCSLWTIEKQEQCPCEKHQYSCCHSIFPWFPDNLQYAVWYLSFIVHTVSCNIDILT